MATGAGWAGSKVREPLGSNGITVLVRIGSCGVVDLKASLNRPRSFCFSGAAWCPGLKIAGNSKSAASSAIILARRWSVYCTSTFIDRALVPSSAILVRIEARMSSTLCCVAPFIIVMTLTSSANSNSRTASAPRCLPRPVRLSGEHPAHVFFVLTASPETAKSCSPRLTNKYFPRPLL